MFQFGFDSLAGAIRYMYISDIRQRTCELNYATLSEITDFIVAGTVKISSGCAAEWRVYDLLTETRE